MMNMILKQKNRYSPLPFLLIRRNLAKDKVFPKRKQNRKHQTGHGNESKIFQGILYSIFHFFLPLWVKAIHEGMSTNVKIKRVHLNLNQTDESSLIGIVSAEPDYKLSLALNKKLKISLRNVTPITFSDTNGTDLTFSRFSDISAAPDLSYNVT